MPENEPAGNQHGARIHKVGDRVLVKQTVLRGDPPKYVIDGQRERHADLADDHAVAAAVRLALAGQM